MDPTLDAVAEESSLRVPPTLMKRLARAAVSRRTLRIVTWVWLAALIAGSLQGTRPHVLKQAGAHSILHWIAFGGVAFLLFVLSHSVRQEIVRAITIFFLGFSLEIAQYLSNRKFIEWHDVRDDGLAALTALVIYRLTGAWKPRAEDQAA